MILVTEIPTYAVVDIEATGGSVAAGDRIIQIGCVLIEEKKVIQQVSIKINPDKSIPKEIEALKHAMSMAEEGTFITALSDVVTNAIDLVQEYQNREILDEGKII